jgi:regulator of protease activity HflC (stomatin/prohibitin superfamily)
MLILAAIVVVYLIVSINILAEYERGVIFRLGKLLPAPKGPGVILVFAPIDRIVRVSLRTVVMDVPAAGRHHARQCFGEGECGGVLSRDGSAPCHRRGGELPYATSQLAQTTLRSVLGQVDLDDLLSERERLNQQLQLQLDQHTDPWASRCRPSRSSTWIYRTTCSARWRGRRKPSARSVLKSSMRLANWKPRKSCRRLPT